MVSGERSEGWMLEELGVLRKVVEPMDAHGQGELREMAGVLRGMFQEAGRFPMLAIAQSVERMCVYMDLRREFGDAWVVKSDQGDEFELDTRPGAINYLRSQEDVGPLRPGRQPGEAGLFWVCGDCWDVSGGRVSLTWQPPDQKVGVCHYCGERYEFGSRYGWEELARETGVVRDVG